MSAQIQDLAAVGIQCSASLSALGASAQDVRQALTQRESCLSTREDLLLGQSSRIQSISL